MSVRCLVGYKEGGSRGSRWEVIGGQAEGNAGDGRGRILKAGGMTWSDSYIENHGVPLGGRQERTREG